MTKTERLAREKMEKQLGELTQGAPVRRKKRGDHVLMRLCAVAGIRNLCRDPAQTPMYELDPIDTSISDQAFGKIEPRGVDLFCTERWPEEPVWCTSLSWPREGLYGHFGRPVLEANGTVMVLEKAVYRDGAMWVYYTDAKTNIPQALTAEWLLNLNPKFVAIATAKKNGKYQLYQLPKKVAG